MSKRAAALLLLAALAPAGAMMRKPRVDKSMETNGSFCRVTEPCHRIIETPAQWKALWSDLGKPPPAADLVKNFAVAAFAGTRNSGGFSVKFDAPIAEGKALLIRYTVVKPKGMAMMALTQPYAVRLFPKTGKAVRVEGREE